jgi:hypothetical protein
MAVQIFGRQTFLDRIAVEWIGFHKDLRADIFVGENVTLVIAVNLVFRRVDRLATLRRRFAIEAAKSRNPTC